MVKQFPIEFTLDSGTHVVVDRIETDTYDFTLKPHDGPSRHFTYIEGEKTKAELDETLDFEQLEALRTFWLEDEDVV